jgi:hypothetical protein
MNAKHWWNDFWQGKIEVFREELKVYSTKFPCGIPWI